MTAPAHDSHTAKASNPAIERWIFQERFWKRIGPLAIVVAGLLAYHNSFDGPFVFDDKDAIQLNPHIRHIWPLGDALFGQKHSAISQRPVVAFTFVINYALGGSNVRGYHWTNLTIHVLAGLALFGVVRRTLECERLRTRYGRDARGLALTVALIWLVHPLHTAAVDYIVQRTELLMGLFFLLTIYCAVRGIEASNHRGWFAAAVTACALGMGSKEVMVAAPLLVSLYDLVFFTRSFRHSFRQRGGLYIGLAATWGILAALVLLIHAPGESAGFGVAQITPWRYLMTQAGVIAHYLRLCFWPHPLVLDYSDWPIAERLSNVWQYFVLLACLLVATVVALRRNPPLGFLGAWFFLILAPTSSFMPILTEPAAERRMYLPLVAIVSLVVIVAYSSIEYLWRRLARPAAWSRLLWTGGPLVLVVLLGATTVRRNEDYQTDVSIWQDAVQKRPNSTRARANLGLTLFERGRTAEAIAQYEAALKLSPSWELIHNNLGVACASQGKLNEAIAYYFEAIQLNPKFSEPHLNLGKIFADRGNHERAIIEYSAAIQLKTDNPDAHYHLGLALIKQGRFDEAIAEYQEAVRFEPEYAEARYALALALAGRGRNAEAIPQYVEAMRLKPGNATAHYNLGVTLASQGRYAEAIASYEAALGLRAAYPEARNNLGLSLAAMGRGNDAAAQYQEAIRLKPEYAKAHFNLGHLLMGQGKTNDALVSFHEAERLEPALRQAIQQRLQPSLESPR